MITAGVTFQYVVHTTGSSSTQAGLVAGFKALGVTAHVVGIADDAETAIKRNRVLDLANDALSRLGLSASVEPEDVEVTASNAAEYGYADDAIKEGIYLMATKEGLIADPVYEGRAIRGLLDQNGSGRFEKGSRILLIHLGGAPAVHAYAEQFDKVQMKSFNPQ